MTIPRAFATLALLLASASPALPDGKFYAREGIPPSVPYQHALLMFDEGKETLILQSKFSTAGKSAPDAALGWVVPTPAVPELDSMKSEQALQLFLHLRLSSRPNVTKIPLSLIISLLAVVAFVVICRAKKVRTIYLLGGIICWLMLALLLTPMIFQFGTRESGIDVIHEREVGIYQAKVIQAADSSSLIAWLNEGGFQFQSSEQPVLDDYLKRGWVFVVAKVKPEERRKMGDTYEGMPDPLILRFESRTPVYPLALTGTTGMATEVTLYVLSRSKWQARDGLSLLFASPVWTGLVATGVFESPIAFKPWEQELPYLCTFKGTLTPEQMRKDIELKPAADNARYREHRIIWW